MPDRRRTRNAKLTSDNYLLFVFAVRTKKRAGFRLTKNQAIATQSISISNGPVHSGTQTKMRAGGASGK